MTVACVVASVPQAHAGYQFAGQWGNTGSADGQFNYPMGIGVNHSTGEVYVADTRNHRIQRFGAEGTFLGTWGDEGSGDGEFRDPVDIAVNSSSGEVYVADGGNHRIQRFGAEGTFLGTWGDEGSGDGEFRFWQPNAGLAVNPSSGEVYVVDGGNDRVQRFGAGGVYRGQWGNAGSGDGEFWNPGGIAVNRSTGDIYVADRGNARIERFDATGGFLGRWGLAGSDDGQFMGARDVAINPATSEIYVLDYGREPHSRLQVTRIQRFSNTGTFLGKWGRAGSEVAQFHEPHGVAHNAASGEVYVADSGNGRIQRFRPPEPVPPAPDTDQGGDVTIRILGKRLAMNRKRVVRTRLRCPASVQAPPCRGRLVLRTAKKVRFGSKRRNVRLARTRFAIGGGKAQRARARLNRPRARLVRRNKRARTVRVIVRVRDQAGNSARVVKRMRLRTKRAE